MNVYEKLNNVRLDFLTTKHNKSGNNKFAGYRYFELSDFLPSVMQSCQKHGVCGVFRICDGYANLDIIDCEKPQDKIVFTAPYATAQLKGCHEVQNLGASVTYLRRYLWGMAVELIENDAIDASEPIAPRQVTGLSDSEMADVQTLLTECVSVEALKKAFGPAWKKASNAQKQVLKAIYDDMKATLEKEQANGNK